MSILVISVLALLVIGALAGVLAGLLGVGGGIVLVPAFYFLFSALDYTHDQLMQICLATSLATIVVTSARSVMSHHKKGAVDWDILRGFGPEIILGAILGVFIAAELRSETLQAIFGGLAICIGLYMAFGNPKRVLVDGMPTGWLKWVYGPVIGFLSVLMGIGGGSFGVPLMTLHGRPIHRAVATAAGFGCLIALPSVIGFLLAPVSAEMRPPFTIGYVNIPAFLIVISMTIFTAPLGAKLAHRLNAVLLRRIFAGFLIMVALNMLGQVLLG